MKKMQFTILASQVINLSAVMLPAPDVLNPVTCTLRHNFGSVYAVVIPALLKDTDSAN